MSKKDFENGREIASLEQKIKRIERILKIQKHKRALVQEAILESAESIFNKYWRLAEQYGADTMYAQQIYYLFRED